MRENEQRLSTEELLQMLFKQKSLETVFANNEGSFGIQSFSDCITELCKARNEVPERIIERAGLEKSYGHKIFTGKRSPSRDMVIRIAFGFEADVDLAQKLLRLAGKSPLYPRVKRDTVIIYCLYNHYTVTETQLALDTLNLPYFSGEGRE